MCPGKKFSQVEFVAVVATMLHKYRIKPTVVKGETEEQAKMRLLGVTKDVEFVLTPKIRRPLDAGMVFEERDDNLILGQV